MEFKEVALSGVLTSELKFRVKDAGTPLIYTLAFANADEEKANTAIQSLIEVSAVSGGVGANLCYSPYIKELIGKSCRIDVEIYYGAKLSFGVRVRDISLYDKEDDGCFPYPCHH